MVKKKLIILLTIFIFAGLAQAQSYTDQWSISEKTYKDLIEEGFEVKSYDTTTINLERGLTILFFVTVLQKDKEVFECQEYQTLDSEMQTLDMSLVCKKLTQPYKQGVGT